jgi:outer membrane biosynthesis protein TonB
VWLTGERDTFEVLVDLERERMVIRPGMPNSLGITREYRWNLLQMARAAFPADTVLRDLPDGPPARMGAASEALADEPPVLIKAVPAVYPGYARRDGFEAKIVGNVFVGADGLVHQIHLQRGNPAFNAAYVNAVSEYVFQPAKRKGVAVGVWVLVPINFRLHN